MQSLSIPVLVVAVLGIIGGFFLSRRGDSRGPVVMTVAALLGMTVGLMRWVWNPGGAEEHPVKVMESRFAGIAARRLGAHLAAEHPGATALVILPFELRTSEDHRKAMIDELTAGLGGKIAIAKVIDPPLPANVRLAYQAAYSPDMEPQEVPEFASWFTAAYFDKLLAEHPGDYTLVISLAGLPEDGRAMRVWKNPRRPKFAMIFGPMHTLAPLIHSGDIVAAVEHHPAPSHEALPPEEDIITAFDRRYLLITPRNLAEMKGKYPQLY